MDIPEYIFNNFINGDLKEKIAPVMDAISKNGFNLEKILQSVDITTLLPLLGSLFGGATKSAPAAADANPLTPISGIADRDIVFALNRYLSSAQPQ